jgi:hypothetical protein
VVNSLQGTRPRNTHASSDCRENNKSHDNLVVVPRYYKTASLRSSVGPV